MRKALITRKPSPLFSDPFFRGFERLFNDDLLSRWNEGTAASRWIPPVDVREHDDALEFTAELPGLAKDDLDITVEDRVLTLSGERKFESGEDKNGFHRIERSYGSFTRSFTLPHEVEQDKVTAVFKDGLLTVRIPKTEQAKPRKIEIS